MTQTSVWKIFTIQNVRGLHARAAAAFVKVVEKYKVDVNVILENQEVSGHSIMGLMTLGASRGTQIKVICTGKQAEIALGALGKLVDDKFYED